MEERGEYYVGVTKILLVSFFENERERERENSLEVLWTVIERETLTVGMFGLLRMSYHRC